jgi:hypothetical protein
MTAAGGRGPGAATPGVRSRPPGEADTEAGGERDFKDADITALCFLCVFFFFSIRCHTQANCNYVFFSHGRVL